jgi:hypothetical protein
MERGSRKRSSSARSEKMERAGDRWEKMEGYCSTCQSPQLAVVTMAEEEELTYSLQQRSSWATVICIMAMSVI